MGGIERDGGHAVGRRMGGVWLAVDGTDCAGLALARLLAAGYEDGSADAGGRAIPGLAAGGGGFPDLEERAYARSKDHVNVFCGWREAWCRILSLQTRGDGAAAFAGTGTGRSFP